STCADGIKNQDETDVDCGGAVCPKKCLPQQSSPTCTDGVKNHDESDVDCGGAICTKKCLPQEGCRSSSDCTSNNCDVIKKKCLMSIGTMDPVRLVCCDIHAPGKKCLDGTSPAPHCGFGRCDTDGCNCIGGCRYYDNGDTQQPFVTSVDLFGNGAVFFNYHHVLVVLTTNDGKYHLLEVLGNIGQQIIINHKEDDTLNKVLRKRNNKERPVERWGITESTRRPWSAIEKVIELFENSDFHLIENNSRHFAGIIHHVCGIYDKPKTTLGCGFGRGGCGLVDWYGSRS
ncbi:unnamed protein product, partial [Adineta steineri]